jgi:outer membrane protein OmpA-like peptidoglycan-associated protein
MSTKKDNFWIPYADLMTVLMVIFLFIAVAFMASVQKEKNEQNKRLIEYFETKNRITNSLDSTFKKDFVLWNVDFDSSDLSIKFTNPEVLFASGSSSISKKFEEVLSQFLPKYLDIILREKEQDISEIRIEGHTDNVPIRESNDPYIDNVKLSQDRSRAVLAFLRTLDQYERLNEQQKARLQFWFTANGLSFGRTLDKNKKLTNLTKDSIDMANSRRVEFRIVTNSEGLVEEMNKRLK